jgi:DNA-binding MarR family transcriptional regulator
LNVRTFIVGNSISRTTDATFPVSPSLKWCSKIHDVAFDLFMNSPTKRTSPQREPSASVAHLVADVSAAISAFAKHQCIDKLGITARQASVLRAVGANPKVTIGELARRIGIDASTATRMTDRLEKIGLLVRKREKGDRRVVKLALTAQGHELAERVPDCFNQVFGVLLADFTQNEIRMLNKSLYRMLGNSSENIER